MYNRLSFRFLESFPLFGTLREFSLRLRPNDCNLLNTQNPKQQRVFVSQECAAISDAFSGPESDDEADSGDSDVMDILAIEERDVDYDDQVQSDFDFGLDDDLEIPDDAGRQPAVEARTATRMSTRNTNGLEQAGALTGYAWLYQSARTSLFRTAPKARQFNLYPYANLTARQLRDESSYQKSLQHAKSRGRVKLLVVDDSHNAKPTGSLAGPPRVHQEENPLRDAFCMLFNINGRDTFLETVRLTLAGQRIQVGNRNFHELKHYFRYGSKIIGNMSTGLGISGTIGTKDTLRSISLALFELSEEERCKAALTLLDIGAGSGHVLLHASKLGIPFVVGTDLASSASNMRAARDAVIGVVSDLGLATEVCVLPGEVSDNHVGGVVSCACFLNYGLLVVKLVVF